jgi:hypothetical protein
MIRSALIVNRFEKCTIDSFARHFSLNLIFILDGEVIITIDLQIAKLFSWWLFIRGFCSSKKVAL